MRIVASRQLWWGVFVVLVRARCVVLALLVCSALCVGTAAPLLRSDAPAPVIPGLTALGPLPTSPIIPLPASPHRLLPPIRHPAPADDLWLHGVGSQLYTAAGAPITLRAVNWYGFEHAPYVPEGLDHTALDTLLQTLRAAGFNAIRLLFGDATVAWDPVVTQGLAANPQLRGHRALDIMRIILQHAHTFGLHVILCDSRAEPGYGPETATGLWYLPHTSYTPARWAANWLKVVALFRHESAFVGADLWNEPHLAAPALRVKYYPIYGPTWGPYHGRLYPALDWRLAAQTLGNQLLRINPNLLIIVEGVQAYFNPVKHEFSVSWWGSNLVGVKFAPILLSRPSQLVYSAHDYGPILWPAQWFNKHTTYRSLAKDWTYFWAYLLHAPPPLQAPLFLGEFGTCNFAPYCIGFGLKAYSSSHVGSQGVSSRSLAAQPSRPQSARSKPTGRLGKGAKAPRLGTKPKTPHRSAKPTPPHRGTKAKTPHHGPKAKTPRPSTGTPPTSQQPVGLKYHNRQALWFRSLVRFLHTHPQISWAYFALNPLGPFKPTDLNFYSLMTPDWRHVNGLLLRGLAPLMPQTHLVIDCCRTPPKPSPKPETS